VTIYLPYDLEAQVRDAGVSLSPVCQEALREEIRRVQAQNKVSKGMEPLTIKPWRDDSGEIYEAEFVGTWLVFSDPDESRADQSDYQKADWDAGAYWRIALTASKNIRICTAHCNDRWAPSYQVVDSIDDVTDIPHSLRAAAAVQLGENFVVRLDV
jgi:hypothetical protein